MPLSRANLQFVTGLGRARLEKWLDQLVAENILDLDSDDSGELIWIVRGAERPVRGPEKAEEVRRLAELRQEVQGGRDAAPPRHHRERRLEELRREVHASAPASLIRMGAASLTQSHTAGEPHKSLVASGLLSFFFGPLGWLYAAPLKEAGLAIAAYMVLCAILPHFLLAMLLGVINPVSAGVGVLYAWRYNQKGERTPLLPPDPRRVLPPHD